MLFKLRKKKIVSFVTMWMNLRNTVLIEISQAHKDKYHVMSLPYGIQRSEAQRQRVERCFPGAWRGGEEGELGRCWMQSFN
jgi:hypothetical protein